MTAMAILEIHDLRSKGPVMEVIESKEQESRDLEKKLLQGSRRNCTVEACCMPALVVLGQQPLCLMHFIVRCYEWLDYLDPMIRGKICALSELARVQSLVEECSNRALLVSLRCEDLSNLSRSRLLDILLLSSDLLFILRLPRSESPTLLAYRPKPENRAAFAPISRVAQTAR
jgi:hypothetical protein